MRRPLGGRRHEPFELSRSHSDGLLELLVFGLPLTIQLAEPLRLLEAKAQRV